MSGCPVHRLRSDLPALPPGIDKLPVDERGYPVPWFVSWPDPSRPEFRMADARKMKLAVIQHLCWVCGQRLRGLKSYTVGPMCVINRNSGEPPAHLACAEFSVKACPFLTRPNMDRREDDFTRTHGKEGGGVMLKRNPGVVAIWTTFNSVPYRDPAGGQLFRFPGEPEALSWWREGRAATRAEVLESIESGIPLLLKCCAGPSDIRDLEEAKSAMMKYLPAK